MPEKTRKTISSLHAAERAKVTLADMRTLLNTGQIEFERGERGLRHVYVDSLERYINAKTEVSKPDPLGAEEVTLKDAVIMTHLSQNTILGWIAMGEVESRENVLGTLLINFDSLQRRMRR